VLREVHLRTQRLSTSRIVSSYWSDLLGTLHSVRELSAMQHIRPTAAPSAVRRRPTAGSGASKALKGLASLPRA